MSRWGWAVTTRIDVEEYFDTVWQAIVCHPSQLPGYGQLLDLPRQARVGIWREGTLLQIFSLVNAGRSVERDLFEGLRKVDLFSEDAAEDTGT